MMSCAESVAEPVARAGDADGDRWDPMDEAYATETYALTPGLRAVIGALRNPETMFGKLSDRPADVISQPLNWDEVPDEIRRYLSYWDARCTDLLFHLYMAAAVLRDHGVQVCRGEPSILFLWEEDTMDIFIRISIDATSRRASELKWELIERTCDFEVPCTGFVITFMPGHSDVHDEDDDQDEGEHDEFLKSILSESEACHADQAM